jgi:succinate dehydrogenase/fumarate reductase flavoprotein subunit
MKNHQIHKTDVLVIGGGLAGMRSAQTAREGGAEVILVMKGSGASPWVFGFNAPVGSKDSSEIYYNDILQSGGYINNRNLAKVMAEGAVNAVSDLEKMGMNFDKDGKQYHLLQPLGCSCPRYVHYKNSTGREAVKLLRDDIRRKGVIIIQNTMITDLVVHNGKIIGACGISQKDGNLMIFCAKAIVIAAGGCGRIYPLSTYPEDITSDGYAMAYQIGAELIDMEFMQFEPCGIVYPESLRGEIIVTTLLMEGGQLRDGKGERFMLGYEPKRGEKVQKDELARAIHKEINEGRGTKHKGVYFDVSMLPREVIVTAHSMSYEPILKAGIDLTKEPAEVAPIAHTFIGGIKIDERCATSIEGLYAAGEAAGGIHGANRMGGNAGTEILVFGARAGKYASEYALSRYFESDRNIHEDFAERKMKLFDSLKIQRNNGLTPSFLRKQIQEIMQGKVNIIKSKKRLEEALNELYGLEEMLPKLTASDITQIIEFHQIQNMIITAKIVATAALTRTESRGTHYRNDFPKKNDKDWLKNIIIMKSNGKIEAQTFKIETSV